MQIVVVIPLPLILRSFIGLAPGVGRETDGAVRQRLRAANYGVDTEGAEFISERFGNCGEPGWR